MALQAAIKLGHVTHALKLKPKNQETAATMDHYLTCIIQNNYIDINIDIVSASP